jgi:hypothetical protein
VAVEELDLHRDGALEGELHRVANQVEEDLPVALLVCEDALWHLIVDVHYKLKVFSVDLEVHYRGYLCDGLSNVEELLEYLEFIVFDSAHVQCILNYIL